MILAYSIFVCGDFVWFWYQDRAGLMKTYSSLFSIVFVVLFFLSSYFVLFPCDLVNVLVLYFNPFFFWGSVSIIDFVLLLPWGLYLSLSIIYHHLLIIILNCYPLKLKLILKTFHFHFCLSSLIFLTYFTSFCLCIPPFLFCVFWVWI